MLTRHEKLRRMLRALLAGSLALALLAAADTQAVRAPCRAASLSTRFLKIPHSEGAGSVSYRVRVRNQGHVACTLSGRPGLRLLDENRHKLPTHVAPDGRATPVLVILRAQQVAIADARFTPDIPD